METTKVSYPITTKRLEQFFYYIPKPHSTAELLAAWDDRKTHYNTSFIWKTKKVELPKCNLKHRVGYWKFCTDCLKSLYCI